MAVRIPRSLVEYVLLGPTSDRRQLQDSPILGDVWAAFAEDATKERDVLITPARDKSAGEVAVVIDERVEREDADVAYLQGVVAARLSFWEVLRVVVPLTEWWDNAQNQEELRKWRDPNSGPEKAKDVLEEMLNIAKGWTSTSGDRHRERPLATFDRYVGLAGLILWVWETRKPANPGSNEPDESPSEAFKAATVDQIAALLEDLLRNIEKRKAEEKEDRKALVKLISLDRKASPALDRSVPAVKADAARTLFTVNCGEIRWAVIDSGIDATHPAFLTEDGAKSRIDKSFEFSDFRRIVSLSNRHDGTRRENLAKLQEYRRTMPADADQRLKALAEGARKGQPVDWEQVEALVSIDLKQTPTGDHGTHVAGIIGASKRSAQNQAIRSKVSEQMFPGEDKASVRDKLEADPAAAKEFERNLAAETARVAAGIGVEQAVADGMCPDIRFYDFRVLAPSTRAIDDTEFAVIAALQYIRYLNERSRYVAIHGANLSLSIPHDVRNYACGRTPVCNECERLVDSGTVVVAAAGNRGYHSFETKEGSYEGYMAFSITDPGNADGVVTVGATHRNYPHTYGVSFFSSRGPTGDGRPKPDLVAPGERIRAPLPGNKWGDHDGTSMAAPHVSGAAAMLMARYPELIGQPRRIKRILCDSATDLGRERSFQGHGMLDVLRAFQSV